MFYQKMLCQLSLLGQSREAIQAQLLRLEQQMAGLLQTSASATTIRFPTDLNPVIDALVAGQCSQAAGLLAAPNQNTPIWTTDYNALINDQFESVENYSVNTVSYCSDIQTQPAKLLAVSRPLPTLRLPTGNRKLTSLAVGDVLGVYDYAVFVTKVNTTSSPLSGEGLVRLPFLKGAMLLVEFSGVSAKAGEEGTNGGCVYDIDPSGYFRTKSADKDQLQAAQQGLVAQLLSQSTSSGPSPTAPSGQGAGPYVGTLGQALAQYDSLVSRSGPASQPLSARTQVALQQNIAAIEQGSQTLQTRLEEVYGGTSNPAVIGVWDSLASLVTQVQTLHRSLPVDSTQALRLPQLATRYQALFDQLARLIQPVQAPTSSVPTLAPIVLSGLTETGVKLNWQGVASVSKYVVHYKLEGAGEQQQTVTSPNAQLVNLKAGGYYTYSIEGYQGSQPLSSYKGMSFKTLFKSISTPQNLAYTVVDEHTVKLNWDKDSQYLSYRLTYTDKSGEQRTVYPSTNEYTLKGLESNQMYPYTLIAYDAAAGMSEAARATFQLGTVCYATISASAERVIEGTTVALAVNSCRTADGQEGVVTWQGKGLPQTFGTTQVFRPSETAIYTSHCQLQVDKGNGPELITCLDTKTIVVDKACKGVTATVSPATIEAGQPIILQSTGCSNNIQWGMGYPTSEGVVSTYQSAVIYPSIAQNAAKTFTLSCIDRIGTACLVQAGTVYAKCAFKLGVSNQSSGGIWGINSKVNKTITIEAAGCSSDITWTRDGGNINIDVNHVNEQVPKNKIIYSNIREGFTVNATCNATGCKATTGFLEAPSTSSLCDLNNVLNIIDVSTDKKNLKLRVSVTKTNSNNTQSTGPTDLPFTWDDDGSTTNPRTIPFPDVPSIFSVSTEIGGCKAAFRFEPSTPSQPALLAPIPCFVFTAPSPVMVEIPWNGTSKDVTLSTSGCTDPTPGMVSWQDQNGKPVGSNNSGSLSVPFSTTGTYSYSATCELTKAVKVVVVTVTKGTKTPINFTVTTPVIATIPAGGDPIDVTLKSSGCVDADLAVGAGTVTWKNQNGSQIASDKTGTTRVAFTSAGTYMYSATCSLNGATKNVTVNVSNQSVTPILPTDPCNFYVTVPYPASSYYNVWGLADPIQLDVNGATNLQFTTESLSPLGMFANASWGNGKITVSHASIEGSFWLRVTNTTSAGQCSTKLFITLNDNRDVYIRPFRPAGVPEFPLYTPPPKTLRRHPQPQTVPAIEVLKRLSVITPPQLRRI